MNYLCSVASILKYLCNAMIVYIVIIELLLLYFNDWSLHLFISIVVLLLFRIVLAKMYEIICDR